MVKGKEATLTEIRELIEGDDTYVSDEPFFVADFEDIKPSTYVVEIDTRKGEGHTTIPVYRSTDRRLAKARCDELNRAIDRYVRAILLGVVIFGDKAQGDSDG